MRKASTLARFQTEGSEKGEHIFKISDKREQERRAHYQDFRLKKVRKASTFSRFPTKESEKGEHLIKISD